MNGFSQTDIHGLLLVCYENPTYRHSLTALLRQSFPRHVIDIKLAKFNPLHDKLYMYAHVSHPPVGPIPPLDCCVRVSDMGGVWRRGVGYKHWVMR